MGYINFVYVKFMMIFAHFMGNLRSNKGKSKIPLFDILAI